MDTPRLSILIALLTSATALSAQTTDGFGTDFEAASKLALETGRPLLVHFFADYCPPCRRMEREVLHDAELNARLNELVIAVKVNTAKRPDLARRFGVERIPHDRILTPDGKELTRTGGFIEKWTYLETVRNAVAGFNAAEPKVVVKSGSPQSKKPGTQASGKPVGSKSVVSLDGYCPVTLNAHRKWIKGNSRYEVEYKGLSYRLQSQKEFDLFKAKPERYAPQILGCDPVVLASSHRAIPGRTDFGAFFDGKLYLFESVESRTQFKKSPLRYVRIRHALDASKIERTAIR